MVELRAGERYSLELEGGACVVALVCEASDRHVLLAPPDVVPWSARLRLPRRAVYSAERVWQAAPRAVDPDALDWFSGLPWVIAKDGAELVAGDRQRRRAKSKPLFPDAVEPKAARRKKST